MACCCLPRVEAIRPAIRRAPSSRGAESGSRLMSECSSPPAAAAHLPVAEPGRPRTAEVLLRAAAACLLQETAETNGGGMARHSSATGDMDSVLADTVPPAHRQQ